MSASRFHCDTSAESRGPGGPVPGTQAPPHRLLVARAQSAHLELAWRKLGFQGDAGAREASPTSHSTSPFPKSVGPPCSPYLWQHCVTAALVYKQAKPFKCHCENDAACSHFQIYPDHRSTPDLARKVFLPLPWLSVPSREPYAILNLCCENDVRVIKSQQRRRFRMTV